MDVIDSHMENLSSQEDDDYICCQNDDDGDCSGWYQHRDEAGHYNGWYQYHDEVGDYNSWYQHHEGDDEHNGLDQQYALVQNHYLAADNHDHALNLPLNEAPSKNLNQNQPEEVAHTENLLAANSDDPIQNLLAANNDHSIQNFLAANNHNHNHACFCAFSRFLVLETTYLYDLLFLEFAKVDDNEVLRNNEEDDDYNCCQNDDDSDCSGWYQHHDEAGDYNGWYQYHDEAGDYNSWYQHHEGDDEHNGLDQQYALVQNLYLDADNYDHALNLTLIEAPSKNLNQNQPEEVAHTENLFAFLFIIFCSLLIEELEDKQRLIQKKITKLEQKLEDYKRELDVIDSHMENLSSQEVDDNEVLRNNEEDDDYNCCQNDDDSDCSGWYQHHDEAGDYNGWYQYHDEAGDYNSWYQHHEGDDEHNGLDQQYALVQNLYLDADNYDHALNLTLIEAPSKNLNQNQPEEVAHTENLLLQIFLFIIFCSLLIEELEDKQRLIQKKITKLEQKLEDYKREMDVIDSHMENLSSQEVDDNEVLRNNEEDDDYNCCQNDDDNDCSDWYQHHDEAGDYNGWYQYHDEAGDYNSCLLIEELEDKQRLIQKKITKLEQKLEDYKREMDVIDSHMENLSSQEVDDNEVLRNNEEDDDYNCCQNDDDNDCSGWYQHHDEAGDYNGWYQYHDEADNHDHALNLTLNEAPSKNLNQNQPEEVAHTENLLAANSDDPIQNFLAANNHHPIQNFLAADNHNHNHACFCALSRFLVLETAYLYDLLFLEFASFLLIEELEDKQRLIEKKITKLEQKLEDYKREMDVIDSHMENLSSQEVDDNEVLRNNEEDDDYNCCQNDDDSDCSGWYQHHDEAGDYNGWYQYHDEAGDYNSWYQHHEGDDEHNGLDQQYALVQNLYLAADNHDHALNLTLNEALSKNLNQNQPEEVAHTENLLPANSDDPIQNFLAANNHHPIQNFLAADNHNHNHACFYAFSRFLVLETNYLYDLLFLEFPSLSCLHLYSFLALLIEELEDKQRLIQKKITKLEQKLEDYKREMDVIDSHMENLSSQEVDDNEVLRNNEEDDDYNCCQNDDDMDCSGWYQHHDEAGDYNGWYQYHDEAGDYNSWYQHHEGDDEHNGLDQQYALVQNLYLAADNHDHALNLTLNEAPSKNLNQNQPEEVAHTENLLAANSDDPIQNFLAANNHHPI
ncbi:hypothetical protein KIW84_031738 [Lathyrus oleraceus]|uniref:Uncharacterized protein n=1 Tax=Pisum sativum TaxID=3888 RepID=A0A9D4XW48_PEA|nr:hypothetical protein KIW84_031738 [Pisum sativum]